ncbi:MAG: hypothetical protein WCA32_04540 [Chromatiaceae bacterium]
MTMPSEDPASEPAVSIPAALYHVFPRGNLVLRAADPTEPPALLGMDVPERVVLLQLTDLTPTMEPLADWGEGLAIDLVMTDPAAELPFLYRCTGLLARHPVRVTVPLLPGVSRAVKLAVSLGFAVRLSGHQPTPETVEEARHALDGYLHNPTVSQPVEPFHGLLLAFLHDSPLSLWSLLERDPERMRVFDDSGKELSNLGPASVTAFHDALVAAGAECRGCEWLSVCGGYFKWPRTDYGCTGVKRLVADVHAAAAELQRGLADYNASRGGASHGI